MKVIYVSTLISKRKNKYIIENCKAKPLQSIQKYNYLLCEGLVQNNVTVKTFSSIPMSSKISDRKIWFEKNEIENGIEFNYLPFINIKVLRQLFLFIFIIISFLRETLFKNNDDKVFICDALNTTISNTCLIMCKLAGIKCIGLFTDLPRDIGKKGIIQKINIFFESKYDSYILLTEYMNEVVNNSKKPFIVLEGICDSDLLQNKFMPFKDRKRKFLYAGGLYEQYGIKYMIEAFLELKEKDIELHVYGSGDLENWIKSIKDNRIIYHGVVANEEVMLAEEESILLINPRFTEADYTKYSFPSKNMEYMSTGTPLLTTKLPGIPKEYFDYVYIIDKETKNGIKEKLKKIISKSTDELEKFGESAKNFVINHKNKFVQAKKLKNFVENKLLIDNFSKCDDSYKSKAFQKYLMAFLILSVLLSRNTLYISMYMGFNVGFYIMFVFSIPILYFYLKTVLNKNNNIWYFNLIILLILFMIISCIFKLDFALYNVTNMISIVIAFCFSQLIDKKMFKKVFIFIMLFLCVTSVINLHILAPLLKNSNILKDVVDIVFKRNSVNTPFINFITSFVVWVPNYTRNFSIFTEPSFFQFYIIIASIFLLYSNEKLSFKVIGTGIFGLTMLTTQSTSGIMIFALLLVNIYFNFMKKLKDKKEKRFVLIISILILLGITNSSYFAKLLKSIKYKLFVPNPSIDARTGSITFAINSFFSCPLFGMKIIDYLSYMNITNTLPSLFAIYGLNVGLIVSYIFIKFANSFDTTKFNKIVILIALVLSTTSHIFIGVISFWILLFTIALGKDDLSESTLDS